MKIYWITILFFCLGLFGTFLFILSHEQVHQIIFTDNGIPSGIHFGFWNTYTIGDTACKTDMCNLAQEINESIGYQTFNIYLIIWAGFLLIILLIESRENKGDMLHKFRKEGGRL